MRSRGIGTDSSHLDSLQKREKKKTKNTTSREYMYGKTQTHASQTHNQGRLEHFKDKHVFSCGLTKFKVNV